MKILILMVMLFLHIIADYNLQGVLAKMKQKKYWEENFPDDFGLYKNDYIIALIEHSFCWAFIVMLPILVRLWVSGNFDNPNIYIVYITFLIVNTLFHAWTDHMKANVGNCSLMTDQIIHITQIIITWCLLWI